MTMNWMWLFLLLALIYAVGFVITWCLPFKRSRLWIGCIVSWGVWLVLFVIYRFAFLTPDYLLNEVADWKQTMDYTWLASVAFPLHHILLIVSTIVLFLKRRK
jgi:hypothetical protein